LTLQSAAKCARDIDAVEAVRQLANDGGLRHAAGVEQWEIRIEATPGNLVHITIIRTSR